LQISGLDEDAFAWTLLEEEKVAVVPGTAFGAAGKGHVRACYATAYEPDRSRRWRGCSALCAGTDRHRCPNCQVVYGIRCHDVRGADERVRHQTPHFHEQL
jgi:hypothetical protein